jgi:thioredoxin 1
MAEASITVIDYKTFDAEVLESSGLVLVDFWADWCQPCKALAPIIDELAEAYTNKVKICKCNVDRSEKLAMHYGVMSIPTVVLFENGTEIDRIIGLRPKQDYEKMLNR